MWDNVSFRAVISNNFTEGRCTSGPYTWRSLVFPYCSKQQADDIYSNTVPMCLYLRSTWLIVAVSVATGSFSFLTMAYFHSSIYNYRYDFHNLIGLIYTMNNWIRCISLFQTNLTLSNNKLLIWFRNESRKNPSLIPLGQLMNIVDKKLAIYLMIFFLPRCVATKATYPFT